MSRRALAVLVAAILIAALWAPLLYPGGKAALLLLDVYSPSFVGTDLAALITPEARVSETTETFGGVAMRVSWWRPGWGDRHPAIMIVNGATPVGNDNVATRQFGTTLARAGYLVMLPEFPFLKAGRLDADGPRIVDAAFAFLRALPETRGRPVGAFGASVGAGIMLAAAGSAPAIARADHLSVLGGYYDLYTYAASVATRSQSGPSTGIVPWQPSAEASERIPPAIEAAMADDADREKVRAAFAAPTYSAAFDRLRSVSARGHDVLDRLSPSTVWASIPPPVFWIHDPDDAFEPLSEALAAEAAPRRGRFRLVVPRLVQHAEVSTGAASRGPLFVIGELWNLLTFTLDVLRVAG
jgi:dienelactone hydrolase